MRISSIGSSQLAAQAQMHSMNESREAGGDSDKSGTQPTQASASPGPRVYTAGQTIGQNINVTAY